MKRRQNNETIFENAKEPHPNETGCRNENFQYKMPSREGYEYLLKGLGLQRL
jgi:hypothetical protein